MPAKQIRRMWLRETSAEHLYEALLQGGVVGCHECDELKRYIKRFIGESSARRIKRLVKKNPKMKCEVS